MLVIKLVNPELLYGLVSLIHRQVSFSFSKDSTFQSVDITKRKVLYTDVMMKRCYQICPGSVNFMNMVAPPLTKCVAR